MWAILSGDPDGGARHKRDLMLKICQLIPELNLSSANVSSSPCLSISLSL